MADKRDYYEILGIQKGAGEDEIKKAYKKKARENHPDLHPDNVEECEEKMKEINEAYAVLSDPERRQRYDQFGHEGVSGADGMGGMGGMGGMYGADMSDIFDSLFGGIFGGGGTSRANAANAPKRGKDINMTINISFMEACMGKSQEISVAHMERCTSCGGSGAENGEAADVCPDCHGRGSIKVTQQTPLGAFSSSRPCPHCSGKGTIIRNPCQKCKGAGRVRVQKKVSLTIPAGINDGQTLRVTGEGDCGQNGGPTGNLNVGVTVRPHPIFTRDGYDIHCEIPITYAQAVLGDEITVPTIDGNVKFNISEGTQNGARTRLKGKGVKHLQRDMRGDQYVKLYIEVPKNLSKKQKELLKEFESSMSDKNYAKRRGFFDKLKDIFN
ncbi:MAG: molecular chaperone DnaJ [Oscillospiraceae bacterium]|nr:molecular chaperone DnaJ [Oscillospiraceae bacterium]